MVVGEKIMKKLSPHISFMSPSMGRIDGRGCDIVLSELKVATLGFFGPIPTLTGKK